MNETFVTFHGWVGSEIRHRTVTTPGSGAGSGSAGQTSVGQTSVASFRVAVTPRIKRGDTWGDGETTWFSVTTWRALADHVRDSVRKGDPVIVHGRLRTETWQRSDSDSIVTLLVEATLVGHDLSRGSSTFTRAVRSASVEDPGADPSAGVVPGRPAQAQGEDPFDQEQVGQMTAVA